ncbi:RagB/SusD family nutrient uptake outer membrane protein [Capnocytophaga canis]|uniref:RagB/SusD family nutrient uptake outer membrane protein n=1 Tax=Capnocytophaga canis TaxID=1848903 RepID=A0A0B7IHJ0_9FLAO|nr:RagB/SusD family nutrient uptake outer membrane protein [Capnocytophaga canis]CEN49433.1 conserved hypothetical protein [Capnocytophaga canis]
MKNLLKTIIIVGSLFSVGCNDDFLEKHPLDKPTEANAFKNFDNFKAFAYPLYGLFPGGNNYHADRYAGYLTHKGVSAQNPYAWQTIGDAVSGNGWDFGHIRRANMLLANIDKSEMTQDEKNYWRAVGYFFHSYKYMELVNRFGDVPWVETVLNEDSPEAFGPRTPRKEVTDKILERLKWAEQHIGGAKSGKNTISQDVVRVVLSRFALREATWRKYHNLGDYEKYLEECVRVSEVLMKSYPALYTGTDGQVAAGYGELWTSPSLEGVPGVILRKEYFDHSYFRHNDSYLEHTSSHFIEMPQHTVDMYLTKDGLPIHNAANTLYAGDKTPYETFRNRDPRLYHTVIPPYKVLARSPKAGEEGGSGWTYTNNPADREYIDIMKPNITKSNPGEGMKRLPAQNWSASLVPTIPNFVGGVGAKGFVSCRSGYYVWKNYSGWEKSFNNGALNTSDKPIFKIEEVLLNYAEAKFELGAFNQDVADRSINRLRDRASVGRMIVANVDDSFDPQRDKTVDPVLWEIRRERIIELMGEGFGFDDVRRWKKADWFVNKQAYGMWIKKSTLVGKEGPTAIVDLNSGHANPAATEGYRYLYNDPVKDGKGWLDKYYLYEVPSNEILLNPALKPNNPGYEK